MKTFAILALLLLLPPALLPAAGHKSVPVLPVNGTSITVVVSGNEREYSLLPAGAPVKFQVDGPGRLAVVSRLIFTKGGEDAQRYSIRVMKGNDTLKVHSTQADRSDAVIKNSRDVPGKSRKFTLDIPDGSFTFELWADNAPHGAAVRLLFTPAKETKKLIAIEPLSYDRIVTTLINENQLAYYVASRERSVKLRVVGPTRVRVNIRLNYDQTMKGEQKFSVVVTEGQNGAAQWSLQTTKSVGIAYQEWKEVVPGKLNAASFDVPAGEHLYSITLGEASAKSVSLKFSVPEADLGNEE
jgi:hypothetical protein